MFENSYFFLGVSTTVRSLKRQKQETNKKLEKQKITIYK